MKTVSALAAALILGAFAMWTIGPTSTAEKSEVVDLIDRLRPFSGEAQGDRRGIRIRFTDLDVTLEVTTKSGDTYYGRAKTLKDAVKMMIADADPEIQDAVKTWRVSMPAHRIPDHLQ